MTPHSASLAGLGPTDPKSAWRRAVRAERRTRSPQDRAAAAAAYRDEILAMVGPCAAGTPVRRVAAYEAMATEPPTHLLVMALLAAGVEVIVPVLRPDLDLDWCLAESEIEPAEPMRTALADTQENLGLDAIATCTMVVVPALAVDRSGARLGQGGGSYDRALVRASAAVVVALVWDNELIESGRLPADPHDVRLHAAVTPSLGRVVVGPGLS